MKNILTKQEGGIYEIVLNRPESLNALNAEMRNDLLAALDEIAGSPTVRCVLLKAAGPGFMAGETSSSFTSRYHNRTPMSAVHISSNL